MRPPIHRNTLGPVTKSKSEKVKYVDDGTYTYSHRDPNMLSTVLTSKYKVIEEYMVANKLVINADKTHLVVMGCMKQLDRQWN